MRYRQKYRTQIAERFRSYTGREHIVFAGRGAAAIWAALKAFGFVDQPVLIPANTCYIVLWAVILSGNRPILVDIDANTGMITAETLSAAGIEHPAVVIPCHLYGLPAPMAEIVAWANAHGAKVIEDAAQAMIAPESTIGSWGNVSIFSFGQGKIIDVGLRGALLCDDATFATEIRRLLAPLPLFDEHIKSLQVQWLAIYWATHPYEDQNPQIAELYPRLFEMYHAITLYNGTSQGFSELKHRLYSYGNSSTHQGTAAPRVEYATSLDTLIDGVFRTLSRPQHHVLWRYPLLVPAGIRGEVFDFLQTWRIDVSRWYPTLQPMTRVLCPEIRQHPTPKADQFSRQIINLPLNDVTDPPQRIIAALTHYRSEKKL